MGGTAMMKQIAALGSQLSSAWLRSQRPTKSATPAPPDVEVNDDGEPATLRTVDDTDREPASNDPAPDKDAVSALQSRVTANERNVTELHGIVRSLAGDRTIDVTGRVSIVEERLDALNRDLSESRQQHASTAARLESDLAAQASKIGELTRTRAARRCPATYAEAATSSAPGPVAGSTTQVLQWRPLYPIDDTRAVGAPPQSTTMLSWKLRPVYVRGFRRQPLSAIRRILKTKGFDIRKIVEIGFLHGTSMLEVWAYEHETNDIVNRLIHHDYRTYFDRRPTEPFLFDSAAFRKLAKPEQEQFANDNFIYRLERITSRVDSCLRRSAKRQFEAMLDWERSRAAPAPDHHHVPMAPAGEQPRPPMSSGPMRPTDAPPAVVPVQAAPSTDESVAPAESPTDDVPVTPEDDRPSIDICDDDAHTNADSCSSCAMGALYPPVASIINELTPPSSDLVEMPADDVRDDNAFQLDSQKSYSMRRRPIAKRQAVSLTLEEEEEGEPSGAADERAGGGPAASADNDAAARSASQTDEQGTMRPVLPAPASAGLAGTTETNPTQRC